MSQRTRVLGGYYREGFLATLIGVLALLGFFVTPYMLVATFAYLCLFVGMLSRRSKELHARLMVTGMVVDLLLVLILEWQRAAIKTAFGFSLTVPQQFHILFSALAVVLYFPVFYLGFRRYRGLTTGGQNRLHLRLGVMAFAFRTLGFILMFTLLTKKGL